MERRKKILKSQLLALLACLALCTLSGCGGGVSAPANGSGQQSFNVELSPSTLSVVRGNQGSSTLTATVAGGVNNSLVLAASGAPDGVSLTFDPGTIPAPGSSNLIVAVASRMPTGTYSIEVGGNENGVQRNAVLTLTVLAEVFLTWEASSSADVIGYNVARSESSGSGYVQLNTGLISETSYVDNTAQSGHTYYYIARAVDSAGRESAGSNEAAADVP